MAKCAKCGVEEKEEDLFEVKGQLICEDCKLEETSKLSSKPCGNFNN